MLPFLRTKVSVPPARQNRAERLRLSKQVGEGMNRALTLVVAPAGFGKTTLMAEWAQGAPMPIAWVSLEPADRSPERFFSYFIYALQQIFPKAGQTALAVLHGGQAVTNESIMLALLNDLSEMPNDFALILDDYHVVGGAEVDAIIQFLLEHRPAQMHFGIISRGIPDLSLTRLRAQDQMVEINATDLRFNDAEILVFLEQMGASLTPDQVVRLNRSVEGWAVGLQLAGLALARHPFDWNIPAGEAHIFEYLAEEVLRRESPEVQEFLKVSALFDRFCTPVLEEVMGGMSESIADILSRIERANLFLVPLDTARTWFRYHALFTEFLRRQISPEEAGKFYRSASTWFEKNSLLDEAIHYATHAADYERAAALLETHYIDIIQRGEQSALLEWLSTLPSDLMEKHPRLWLAKGWAGIISLDSAEAEVCIEKAEALILPNETTDQQRLRGEAKSLKILAGIFAGKVAAVDEISDAFVLLAEQDDLLHSLLHFNLGLHYVMLGNTGLAIDSFTETLRLSKTLNNPLVSIVAQVQMGETRHIRGALGLAERTLQQLIQYTRETLGEHTFLLGMPFISYSDLLREQNRFEEAFDHARQGVAYCQLWQPVASMDGQIVLARLNAAQGCWDEAFSCLESAMKVAETSVSILDDTFVAIHLVRLNLLQGNLSRAVQLIKMYELDENSEGVYYHLWEMTQLVLLRAKIQSLPPSGTSQADLSPALPTIEALSRLIVESERRERVTPVIEALLLRAYAQHAIAEHAGAIESLSHAFTLGAQSGYIRIFADEGRQLLHLIEQYRSNLHAPRTFVEEIHNLIHKELAAQSTMNVVEGQQLMPLTRRELDILQLLAAGKSNQEIAEERVLTLNTVKKHVANILQKMGVANRTQAVMLAKKMGWME